MRPARAAALGLVLLTAAACGGGSDDDTAEPTEEPTAESSATGSDEPTSDPSASVTEDGPASEAPEGDPPGTASTGEALPPVDGEACTADVALTGAVTSSWQAEGVVAQGGAYGPTVTYQSTHEEYGVTIVAAGDGFDAAAYVTSGDAFFGSSPGAAGVAVDPEGGGADVDVDLVAPELPGEVIRIVATFDC
ncbi:MAG TPA: hypothetical protein VGE77_04280 [Nocardioides sp.]